MSVVFINGGSRGIGRAMVELFSANGHKVVFSYNNSEQAALELAERTGARAIRADSSSEKDVERVCNILENEFYGVDILINNAAVSTFSIFTDLTLEAWRRTFAVNVDGAFMYCNKLVHSMINQKYGRIINISSMWGQVGSSCEVHYSASKAALIGMTKALAKELGPSGITVNCIAPGVINTDMNSALSETDLAELCIETPLMKIGEPNDVAETALFLASDKAGFITGAVINVNGGFVV